ncbi:MAG: hypothetical protein O7C59_02050, partial [Rickettsia endosymbiont of Ixodes persulcatus]|nr:hypothetical protein [Rickettsia endosymbiont of Ixodes persulcatus]
LVVVVFEGMVAVITVFTCFVVCIIEVGGLRFASGGLKWIRSLLLFLRFYFWVGVHLWLRGHDFIG